MTETTETSRVEAIEDEVFRRLRRHELVHRGPEFEEILGAAPGLSVSEVSEVDLRLRADSFLSPDDATKTLAMMAVQAHLLADIETIKSVRKHFLKNFELIGACLVYYEERQLKKDLKKQ